MNLGPLPLILNRPVAYDISETVLLPKLSHNDVVLFRLVLLPFSWFACSHNHLASHCEEAQTACGETCGKGMSFPSLQPRLRSQPASQLAATAYSPMRVSHLESKLPPSPAPPAKRNTETTPTSSRPKCRFRSKLNDYCFLKRSQVTQSCPTLHDPVDCSLPGSSVYGILQARILEWVTISFSRGSSQSRDRTQVSHIGGRCFNRWATRQAHLWFRSLHFQVVYYVVIDNWYRYTFAAIKKKKNGVAYNSTNLLSYTVL